MLIVDGIKEFQQQKFTWRDIVEINGKHYAEEFPISGLKDGESVYQIDDFLDAVGRKYNVEPEKIKTYMMDGIDFDPKELCFGAESCGCYINGVPEECYDQKGEVMEMIEIKIKPETREQCNNQRGK